jgi:crotonobetainyl-CoA:carnitine CoA-transferase CaiB-like acyl-CoA transferase
MLALEGIRILDMARLGPGPHCAQIMGDLGAEIIHIEEPGPGEGRRQGRVIRFPDDAAIRRNSRSVALNLKSEGGREVFLRLAQTADVVVEGFRPGVVKRLGVDYEAVRAVKPEIIYAALTGYGQDGPYAGYVGHDINYQAITGMLGMTGPRRGPPVIPGNTVADNAGGGMNSVISILAALLARQRTGAGQYIDMAMVDGLATMMFLTIDEHLTAGNVPRRGETMLTGAYPWYNVYETKDGKYVAVGAIEPWFYENLCRALGREDLIEHQYADGEQREEMFAAFRDIFLTKNRDEWVAQLMPAETCVSPVYEIDEVAGDPHLQHRQLITDVRLPGEPPRRQVGVMARLSQTPGSIRAPGPAPGQHTEELLREIGYDAAAIESLRNAGAIGP